MTYSTTPSRIEAQTVPTETGFTYCAPARGTSLLDLRWVTSSNWVEVDSYLLLGHKSLNGNSNRAVSKAVSSCARIVQNLTRLTSLLSLYTRQEVQPNRGWSSQSSSGNSHSQNSQHEWRFIIISCILLSLYPKTTSIRLAVTLSLSTAGFRT